MIDSDLIELLNDVDLRKGRNKNSNRGVTSKQQDFHVFVDELGRPTDRFLQSLRDENPPSFASVYDEDFPEENDEIDPNEVEVEGNDHPPLRPTTRTRPNVAPDADYFNRIQNAENLVKRLRESPLPVNNHNRNTTKPSKFGSKKPSNARTQRPQDSKLYDPTYLYSQYSKPTDIIKSNIKIKADESSKTTIKIQDPKFNKSDMAYIDAIINDTRNAIHINNPLIKSLKLRLQGQLQTIRELETKLNEIIQLLELRNVEVEDLQRRLQATERRESMPNTYPKSKHTSSSSSSPPATQSTIEKLEENNQKLRGNLEALQLKLTDEQAKRKGAEDRCRSLKEVIDKQKVSKIELDAELSTNQNTIRQLQDKLLKFKKDAKDSVQGVGQLQRELTAYRLQAQHKDKIIQSLQGNIDKGNQEVLSLRDAVSHQNLEIAALRDHMNHLNLQLEVHKEQEATRATQNRLHNMTLETVHRETSSDRRDGGRVSPAPSVFSTSTRERRGGYDNDNEYIGRAASSRTTHSVPSPSMMPRRMIDRHVSQPAQITEKTSPHHHRNPSRDTAYDEGTKSQTTRDTVTGRGLGSLAGQHRGGGTAQPTLPQPSDIKLGFELSKPNIRRTFVTAGKPSFTSTNSSAVAVHSYQQTGNYNRPQSAPSVTSSCRVKSVANVELAAVAAGTTTGKDRSNHRLDQRSSPEKRTDRKQSNPVQTPTRPTSAPSGSAEGATGRSFIRRQYSPSIKLAMTGATDDQDDDEDDSYNDNRNKNNNNGNSGNNILRKNGVVESASHRGKGLPRHPVPPPVTASDRHPQTRNPNPVIVSATASHLRKNQSKVEDSPGSSSSDREQPSRVYDRPTQNQRSFVASDQGSEVFRRRPYSASAVLQGTATTATSTTASSSSTLKPSTSRASDTPSTDDSGDTVLGARQRYYRLQKMYDKVTQISSNRGRTSPAILVPSDSDSDI